MSIHPTYHATSRTRSDFPIIAQCTNHRFRQYTCFRSHLVLPASVRSSRTCCTLSLTPFPGLRRILSFRPILSDLLVWRSLVSPVPLALAGLSASLSPHVRCSHFHVRSSHFHARSSRPHDHGTETHLSQACPAVAVSCIGAAASGWPPTLASGDLLGRRLRRTDRPPPHQREGGGRRRTPPDGADEAPTRGSRRAGRPVSAISRDAAGTGRSLEPRLTFGKLCGSG